jgi:UDP-N-acetylmuramoyl-L-alanyl-D-glutamate--2,6-diaminopimelate ligase
MVLAEILQGVKVIKLFSSYFGKMALTQDISINAVQYDSRKVGNKDLFVAIKGETSDGHAYLDRVIQQGATAVVVQDDGALPDSYFLHANVFKILVPDSRRALARIAANFYRDPSKELTLVGVTGTNGKTTTTHVVRALLEQAGRRTGLVGTIGYQTGSRFIPATHTTPESLELNALLREMRFDGCTAAAMEVSSHALAQHRVDGLQFAAGVFTNLTQDHLDFHGSMDEYFRAKRVLFEMLGTSAVAVTNLDDPRGRAIVEGTAAHVWTYAVHAPADVAAEDVSMTVAGIRMSIRHPGGRFPIASRLTGRFNIENLLAGAATGLALQIAPDAIQAAVERMSPVAGRFEQVVAPAGWTVVIDYAHTPDALEKCLRTIHDLLPADGRVITVFGCGGDRDRTKRPVMGKIASDLSDITIVTSDNPRTEDPEAIISEIIAGIPDGDRARRCADRRRAIHQALDEARPGDIVLLAGKGHETYQVIGKEKVHFDDHEEVERWLTRPRAQG